MIPTVDDLASDPLVVRFAEIYNPPGLTNFLGTVQADTDLTAVRAVTFPPLFTADTATGQLYVDGQYLAGTGAPVTVVWRPDRITRTTEWDGLRLTSVTAMPMGRTAVVQRLTVDNLGSDDRRVSLRYALAGWVTRHAATLTAAIAPAGFNDPTPGDGLVTFVDPETGAATVQGLHHPSAQAQRDAVTAVLDVPAGARAALDFVVALGDDVDQATAVYRAVAGDVAQLLEANEHDWNAELAAVVTPGNDRYSGHLPRLETDDADLLRLYWMGILGVVYFKRDTPHSVLGRTYDTLMPRYWPTVTFLWDYSLSATVHALLDPEVMRRQHAHWMATDIHTCMGTEWLTGAGLGAWYAVNDYAMTRSIAAYAQWTGDLAWLEETDADGRRRADELVGYARSWEEFQTANGLADYGGIGNLLECVSTYVHEVASLNAAAVYSLRTAADIVAALGETEEAQQLRKEADALSERVHQLYADGEGYWHARFPDGTLVPVRHCYDFATVLFAMRDDLSQQQRDEMVAYFERELRTDLWLRALSNADHNAVFSVRADHQWNGAYCAWPSEVAAELYAIGEHERAAGWLKGLARSANQGPYGQAHFAEQVVEPHAGGARKVPGEVPFINDWACSSGGSWVRLVIEGVFGVRAGLDEITASPALTGFDPDARLTGLSWHGRTYTVDAAGVHEE